MSDTKMEEGRTETVENGKEHHHDSNYDHANGTVQLIDSKHVVLIPTPSRDPYDPLNLPEWHKNLIVFIIGMYSAFAVLATSGMGAIAPVVTAMYPDDDPARVTDLLTYPTLFMGIGNLFAMPLSDAVGRRPVFLGSLALSIVAGIWCACSGSSLKSHIAARDILSMAAGQSEALTALIVQEVCFVHQRATKGTWNAAIQGSVCGAMFVATTYLVPAWGLKWWYGIITIVNAVILVFAVLFVPETLYQRVVEDYDGETHEAHSTTTDGAKVERVTTTANHTLDHARYGRRTWRRDLRVFAVAPRWDKMATLYQDAAKGLTVPTVFWLLVLNGAFLGVYVFQSSTFAGILLAPPSGSRPSGSASCSSRSSWPTSWRCPSSGAPKLTPYAHPQPEFRLLTIVLPALAAVTSCVIFGQTGAHPDTPQWSSWAGIAVPYAVGYAAFLGANTVGITYVLDSWPREAGALLLVVAAGRGFISFGLGYATVPSVHRLGYDGASNIYAVVCGVVSVLGVPAFFLGKRVRGWTRRHYWPVE
ncbi:major facilitator superfamily domain-containing protein [Apiospora arundinis]